MNIVDTMVHFNSELTLEKQILITALFRAQPGVIAPRFHSPKMFQIAYDPDQQSSASLLSMAREQDQQAVMIGL